MVRGIEQRNRTSKKTIHIFDIKNNSQTDSNKNRCGRLQGYIWEGFGGLLGAFWVLLGAFWALVGASWALFGRLLHTLGRLLGACWCKIASKKPFRSILV